jgi:hypothetical protein
MLIDEELLRRDFVVVPDTHTGEEALQAASGVSYLIIRFAGGRWAVVQPSELYTKLNLYRMLSAPLSELPDNAVAPHLVRAIQLESTDPRDQALVENLKEKELLILLQGGQVAGLLVGAGRVRGPTRPIGMTLSEEEATAGVEPPAPELVKPGNRYINVELEDRDGRAYNPKEKPLKTGEVYTLLFDVDLEQRAAAIATDLWRYQAPAGEEDAVITIRLETEDFDLLDGPEQKLFVPRSGRSKNRAKFLLEPKHAGECLINAVFLKDGSFIQVMTLKFLVGELFSSQTLGRGVEAAFVVRPRDVSLTILNTGAGFQMILIAPGVAATAVLPLKLDELKDIAAEARQKLLDIVYAEGDGVRYFQQMLDIPPDVGKFALQYLAQAGLLLYQRLFFGPSADEQTRLIGRKLRELAVKEKLNVQIFSQEFVLPWAILYMAERFDPDNIQPELFLGLKHIIEHIPLQPRMLVTDNRVNSQGGFNISLNLNLDIDKEMKVTLVGDQVHYWEALVQGGTKLSIIKRTTTKEVTQALSDPSTPDHVLYFYCHGISQDVDDKGGVDRSRLVLSNKGSLTLEDLKLYAPVINPEDVLANAPLVFINACETAQLSPLIYDGFVPYFMSKGARGVIGTECETPALFAVEWARRFFDRFLRGETLGQIFLDLRREFFFQSNNPMGLLYSLYVDADTRLDPALRADQ